MRKIDARALEHVAVFEQSGGRAESILMSLPPCAAWRYDWHPAPGSAEEALYRDFLVAKDWV